MRLDRLQLARVFDVQPLALTPILLLAGGLAVIPHLWIASLLVGGTGGIVVALDNEAIARGLREVDNWGWPITGYREWLIAQQPAFDLELRRDVAEELVGDAAKAVDARIVVSRRGERVVRVRMPRVELQATQRFPAVQVGDRRLLVEFRDRVLAPLHADVGIVAMRMGDDVTLAALVAAPQSAAADTAFREQAMVAPPDLQSLVHAGTTQLRPPREAKQRKYRTDRLLYATSQVPSSARTMGGLLFGGVLIGMIGGPIGVSIGGAIGIGAAVLMRLGDRGRAKRALELIEESGLPIEGYDDWLLSGRPIFDVEFAAAPEDPQRITADLTRYARGSTVAWLHDRLVRVESAPIEHFAGEGIAMFWGGSPHEVRLLFQTVLVPLKAQIVAVRMGGYVDRRR